MPAALRRTQPPRRRALAPLLAAAGALMAPTMVPLAAAVQYGPPATGPISFEQAKCMLRGKKIAFIGDSNSRYHYFSFNVFLDTGNLRYWKGKGSYNQDGGGSGWGTGGLPDYDGECKNSDCRSTWTDYSTRGGQRCDNQVVSVHPTHWLISTQVATPNTNRNFRSTSTTWTRRRSSFSSKPLGSTTMNGLLVRIWPT